MKRHSRTARLGLALAMAVATFGCADRPTTAAPVLSGGETASLISDAAHDANGVPGFYFRPPMVPNRSYPGTFDPTLSPEVVICEWATSCVTEIARFTTSDGTGGEKVKVESDHYHVNWHAKDFGLDPAKTYRILVNAAGLPLGFADVDVVNNGSELKNVQTQEYIGLVQNRTLPIKFRAERGIPGRLVVDPAEMFLEVGDAQDVTATVYDLHARPLATAVPAWSIAATSGAADNATFAAPTLTAASPGTGTLTAAYGGRSAAAVYTIYEPPASLAFAIACASLPVGTTRSMLATAFDAAAEPITRPLRTRYTSSDAGIAQANETSGDVTGANRGLATISASLMGLNASTAVLVYNAPGEGAAGDAIVIRPADDAQATTLTLDPEAERQLNGSFEGVAITESAFGGCRTWSSDNADVVSVTTDGKITAEAPGSATITLAIGELTGTFAVEVQAPPPPPEEPPPGDEDPACGDEGCSIHLQEWVSSRGVDVNIHGEVLLHVEIRLPGSSALWNRAYFWDGTNAPVMLDMSNAVHCTPRGMNDHRQIVGHCIYPAGAGKPSAAYWQTPQSAQANLLTVANAGTINLGLTSARDINNDGTIVGTALRSYTYPGAGTAWTYAAARWASPTSTPVTLGWTQGTWTGPFSIAEGISPSGRLAGQATRVQQYVCNGCTSGPWQYADVGHAAAAGVNGTALAELGTLSIPSTINNGLAKSYAYAINDDGVAVGWTEVYVSAINNIRRRAVRWNGAAIAALPDIPDAVQRQVNTEASDINNVGWITGSWANNPATNTVSQGFVWKGAGNLVVLPRPASSLSGHADALSQLVDDGNGGKQAYVAGWIGVQTTSGSRPQARLWIVKQ